ncbi:MAG: hypothetical protein WB678_05500 [Stellaceae bacterium]
MKQASPGEVVRPPPGWRPQAALGHYFPAIAEFGRRVDPELRALETLLDSAEAIGRDTSLLRQALGEVRWRLQYTGDLAAADAALARLRVAAALPDPPSGLVPDEDGSYGAGAHVWFLRLDASVDPMLAADFASERPPRFLDRVNHPLSLGRYLDSLVVSRLAEDGVDRRKELNFATADLVRLILRRRPLGYRWDPRLETVIRDFLVRWQDPATGFFGADYEIAGERWRTTDLSMTFHMARYLKGRIGHWPQLIDTLIEIREDRYPNGWLDDNGLTNHNNYDVAVLFQLGWPQMRPAQRERAQHEIARLLSWCLERAIAADGAIAARAAGESLPESYYFAVAFLDTVGFFDSAKRFWTDRRFLEASALRTRLERQIRSLPPGDPMARMALNRLGRGPSAA